MTRDMGMKHLMHNEKSFHVKMVICMEWVWFLCAIACAFQVGSSPCRRIQLLGIAHPVVGSPLSGTGSIQGDGAH